TATAARLADAVSDHPAVRAVRYPHRTDHPHYDIHTRQMSSGGTLVALSLNGARSDAFRVLNALTLFDISNNLGDAKSLACHPASTTHRTLSPEERDSIGLDESWVRLSIGLEDPLDLMDDLLTALDAL
ncbi:MAG: PLP-dependent transferase, partial [Pseudomonadota bacterium]